MENRVNKIETHKHPETLEQRFEDTLQQVISQQRLEYGNAIVSPPERDIAEVRVGNTVLKYATYCGQLSGLEDAPRAGLEVYIYNQHLTVCRRSARFLLTAAPNFVRLLRPDPQKIPLLQVRRELSEPETEQLLGFAEAPHMRTRQLTQLLELNEEEQAELARATERESAARQRLAQDMERINEITRPGGPNPVIS